MELSFQPIVWNCPKHGEQEGGFHLFGQFPKRNYCMTCIMELLDNSPVCKLEKIDEDR